MSTIVKNIVSTQNFHRRLLSIMWLNLIKWMWFLSWFTISTFC